MNDISNRLISFQQRVSGFEWPHRNRQLTPERMASAGFFFRPLKESPDRVVCYACEGILERWQPGDDPVFEHKKCFPNCPFIQNVPMTNVATASSPHRYIGSAASDSLEILFQETFKLLEILFKIIDCDGTKFISKRQLRHLLSSRGQIYGFSLDRIYHLVDEDNNEILSFSEFIHLIFCCWREPVLKDLACFFGFPTNRQIVTKTFTIFQRCIEDRPNGSVHGPDACNVLSSDQLLDLYQKEFPTAYFLPSFKDHIDRFCSPFKNKKELKIAQVLHSLYIMLSRLPNCKFDGSFVDEQPTEPSRMPIQRWSLGTASTWSLMEAALLVLEQDFAGLDVSRDGLLDLEEVKGQVPRWLPPDEALRVAARLQHAFLMVDAERLGQLDFHAFVVLGLQLTLDGSYGHLVPDSRDSALVRRFLHQVHGSFRRFDLDGNRSLSFQELEKLCQECLGCRPQGLGGVFKQVALPQRPGSSREELDLIGLVKALYWVVRPQGPYCPAEYRPARRRRVESGQTLDAPVVSAGTMATRMDSVDSRRFMRSKVVRQVARGGAVWTESLGRYDERCFKGREVEGDLEGDLLDALQREVELLLSLRHPNCEFLVGTNLGCGARTVLMLLESYDASSLFDLYSTKSTRFEYLTLVRLAKECAAGLQAVHELGYMHRNVKSQNVLLTSAMVAKLSGFSYATRAPTSSEVKGTMQWMAPEVLSNWFGTEQAYDKTCDVYSYGVLVYEMTHCRIPFADFGRSQTEIAEYVFRHNRRPIMSTKCPDALAAVIRAAWDRRPRSRPTLTQIMAMLDTARTISPYPHVRSQVPPVPEGTELASISPESRAAAQPAAVWSPDTLPCDVFEPWQRPGSRTAELLEAFAAEAGEEAAEVLGRIQRRHLPMSLTTHPKQAATVLWTDQWSCQEPSRDQQGENLVSELAMLLERRRARFVDPFFPPDNTSIFLDPPAPGGGDADGAGRQFLAGRDMSKVRWLRPCDLLNPSDKVKVWSGEIGPEDIAQGCLGNCYFMAALSACAAGATDLLLSDLLIEDYGHLGLYGVKFFVMGKWVTVAIDDLFPCEPDGLGQWRPLFCAPKKNSRSEADAKEIWPMLFEKAFAKLHGTYETTDSGLSEDALQYLTAGVVELKPLSASDADFDWLLSAGLQLPKPAYGACNPNTAAFTEDQLRRVGLVGGHAYSILKAVRSRSGARLVQVRNPWGRIEWNGRYADGAPEWTADLKQEVGYADEEDGNFFMCFDDFATYFGVCKKVDPRPLNVLSDDKYARIEGAASYWLAGETAGGPLGRPTFDYNPRFLVSGDGGDVILTVYQADVRHSMAFPAAAETFQPYLEVLAYLGPWPGGPLRELMTLAGGCDGDRFRSETVRLAAGQQYLLVAAAARPGVQGAFAVTACGLRAGLSVAPPVGPPSPAHRAAMAAQPPSATAPVATAAAASAVAAATSAAAASEVSAPAAPAAAAAAAAAVAAVSASAAAAECPKRLPSTRRLDPPPPPYDYVPCPRLRKGLPVFEAPNDRPISLS